MPSADREDGFLERFHDRLVGVDHDDEPADESTWLDEEWPKEDDDEWTEEWGEDRPTSEVTFGAPAETPSTRTAAKRNGEKRTIPGSHDRVSGEIRRKNVAATLATEFTAGAVDERTLRTLKRELGLDHESASTVRLDSLAARVSELEAYTDALELLLDRVGTDDDLIARFEDFETTVDDVAAIGDRVDELHAAVRDLESTVDALDDLTRTLDDVRDDVAALRRWQRSLVGAFGGVDADDAPAAGG